MAVQECMNGHLFDTDQSPVCPYCTGNSHRIDFGSNFGGGNIGKTVAAAPDAIMGIPEPAVTPNMNLNLAAAGVSVGKTVAPASYFNQQERSDAEKTVGIFQKRMSFEPVVGWLVCTEGAEKGKDYRILGKNNSIGRSEKMDICIKGDATISRENHARLAYDEKHNAFHLIPGEGANTVYLNDEPVYVPAKLHDYDVIDLGDCKFIFLSLCNDRFKWQKETKPEPDRFSWASEEQRD